MSSPIARGSPLTFPSLSIPTKQVVQKPAENDHNKSETLSCGANDHGQLGHSDYIDTHELRYVTTTTKHLTRVVCGSFHNVSLHHGHIYVWGSNDEGQLGLPEYDISLNAATQVQYNVRKQNFKKIGAGARSSMGVTGTLFTQINTLQQVEKSSFGAAMNMEN
jgi:alpha-tubulin suppressor-like RCC1 family protein